MEKYKLVDNRDEGRFEYKIGDQTPFMEYKLNNQGEIFLTHTNVSQSLRGQGVGSMMAEDVLALAQSRGLKVVPLCGFVAGYMKRNPQWMHILKDGITIG